MNILFIGGTGIISTACASPTVSKGINLTLPNRGKSVRPAATGVHLLLTEIHDFRCTLFSSGQARVRRVGRMDAYTPVDVQKDIDLLREEPGSTYLSVRLRLTKPRS